MIIGENYGFALDPDPIVIPFHDVQQTLDKSGRQMEGSQ